MSTLICAIKFGGCGHIGDGSEWSNVDREGHIVSCPKCGEDHMFQLGYNNFDELTDGVSEEKKTWAMARLDKESASVSGDSLRFYMKEGWIPKDKLTPAQQKELAE